MNHSGKLRQIKRYMCIIFDILIEVAHGINCFRVLRAVSTQIWASRTAVTWCMRSARFYFFGHFGRIFSQILCHASQGVVNWTNLQFITHHKYQWTLPKTTGGDTMNIFLSQWTLMKNFFHLSHITLSCDVYITSRELWASHITGCEQLIKIVQ